MSTEKIITIHQDKSYKKTGDLFGLFFEDINHAADGGLYAELVQNRSFEYCEIDRKGYTPLTAWEKSEGIEWKVSDEKPLNKENTHYLKVTAQQGAFIRNLGYGAGVFLEAGKKYDFSVFARSEKGGTISITIEDDEKNVYAKESLKLAKGNSDGETNGFKRYKLVLTASESTLEGRLVITFENEGTYELDMVSLFPQDTFLGRKYGLRKDIAEALKDMKPKFIRFPGGCLTHDGSLNDHDRNSMYRWRRTLGKIEERPTWRNNWGYNQTLGIGYYEYFCFCEDIGAKPLPVLPGGFNPHKGIGVPIEDIGEWVEEALELIEFANGSADTKMGKIRAEMGHEDPFNLEYLGIGNEEIGDGFFERYPYFHNAIREKYPDIKIINSAGPFAVGEGYDAGWTSAKMYNSDLVDEHYYSSPEWFLANMHHYEDFDANGPKVFLGEYASWGNTYYNAIVEAAYMTHLERSKAVALACYAPMLCNTEYVNWKPDMLWFNNHTIMKTPNYHVQKLFMEYQPTDMVSFTTENLDEIIKLSDKDNLDGKIVIAGNDVTGSIWDVKLINLTDGTTEQAENINISDNSEHEIFDVENCSKYSLEFKFKRSSGRKGLKIFFGRTEGGQILWEFGGWDNWDCNITSCVNGRNSTISHRIFHVEDIEYTLRLETDGRSIKTYVNGQLYNETTDRLPELEELYISAGTDADSGKTIVKAVNLMGEAKCVKLVLEGKVKTNVEIIEMKEHELSETNVIDTPDKFEPVRTNKKIEGNELEHVFAAHSVTVIIYE